MGSLALSPTGHWDIDELIELMEWTRERVGPYGMIIVHNTMTPSCVIENFADYIVAMEWGYGKLSESVPDMRDLPLEWDFMGARSRGVIGYGTIAPGAPEKLSELQALQTLLTGVAVWPFSKESKKLFTILKPLGSLENYRFEDWRNKAVTLKGEHREKFSSALYSRPGETSVIIGNLDSVPHTISCSIDPAEFVYPMSQLHTCQLIAGSQTTALDAEKLIGPGVTIPVPEAGAVLIELK